MNVSMVMSKNFESTFKTINLRLRRCRSFEQLKTKFSFLEDIEKVRNFKNVYVQHRHYLMCKKSHTIYYLKFLF
jgi:hypothetical protein